MKLSGNKAVNLVASGALALTAACASTGTGTGYGPENPGPQTSSQANYSTQPSDSLMDSTGLRRFEARENEMLRKEREKWHWNTANTALALTSLGLQVIDWRQSLDGIRRYPEYKENNPFFGPYPSRKQLNQYFAITAAGTLLLQYMLPNPIRNIIPTGMIFFETYKVNNNLDAGLSFEF